MMLHVPSALCPLRQAVARLVLALVMLAAGSIAQAQRDPTVPAADGSSSAAANTLTHAADLGPMTVIVRDGRPYLVVGTRLFATGQRIGAARIEYIGETEVWMRESGQLHKLPRFPGVQRRPVGPAAASPP